MFHLATYQNHIYFLSNDGTNGDAVWRTDGTESGTELFFDPEEGCTSLYNVEAISCDSGIFFLFRIKNVNELWFSDGTEQGTVLVTNNLPSRMRLLFGTGHSLYFSASKTGASIDDNIWISDATLSGTLELLETPKVYSKQYKFFKWNDKVYFTVRESDKCDLIYITDGSVTGTKKGLELPTANLGTINSICPAGDFLFVNVTNYGASSNYTSQLLSTTASSDSLKVIKKLRYVYTMVPFENRALISGDSAFSSSVWCSDGTAAGTHNLNPGNTLPYITTYGYFNGKLHFAGNGGLWYTDGTKQGTIKYSEQYTIGPSIVYNNKWYFNAVNSAGKQSVFYSDGTSNGTGVLNNPTTPYLVTDEFAGIINNRLCFYANTPEEGHTIWKTDGTEPGTTIVSDLDQCTAGLSIADYKIIDQKIFVSNNYKQVPRVFTIDLNTGDTTNLGYYASWPEPTAGNLARIQNGVYFNGSIDSISTNSGLIFTDGTWSGTKRISHPNEHPLGFRPQYFGIIDDKLYCSAYIKSSNSPGLLIYDGTSISCIDSASGKALLYPRNFTKYGDKVFFIAGDPYVKFELWSTDGTVQGTELILDTVSPQWTGFEPLATLNGKLIFNLNAHLRISDGTKAGTTLIKDAAKSERFKPIIIGDLAIYSAIGSTGGYEIWVTDGSTNGSKILLPKTADELLTELKLINNKVAFQVFDQKTRIWKYYQTDGTEQGTLLLSIDSGGYTYDNLNCGFANGIYYYKKLWPDDSIMASNGTSWNNTSLDMEPGGDWATLKEVFEVEGQAFAFYSDYSHNTELFRLIAPVGLSINEESENLTALKIFPNPSDDKINLSIPTSTQVVIRDMLGKVVLNKKYGGSLDVSELTSGMYVVTVVEGSVSRSAKFIKR